MNPERVRAEWKGPDCEEISLKCESCKRWLPAQEIAVASCDACDQEFYVCEICDGIDKACEYLAEHELVHELDALIAGEIPDWYEDKSERAAQAV